MLLCPLHEGAGDLNYALKSMGEYHKKLISSYIRINYFEQIKQTNKRSTTSMPVSRVTLLAFALAAALAITGVVYTYDSH